MGTMSVSMVSILLLCFGMYYAIKHGVKDGFIAIEADKESLKEKYVIDKTIDKYAWKLSEFSMPFGLPKNMSKEEKKATRKEANKISADIQYYMLGMPKRDIKDVLEETRLLVEQVTNFADDLEASE